MKLRPEIDTQVDTLQNLWVRAVFMTLVIISLSYQKMINIPYTFALPRKFCRMSRCAYEVVEGFGAKENKKHKYLPTGVTEKFNSPKK